ncbi:hypothetical protein RhiirA4_428492 [Rhizophagus irregularis]|uniref:Uncharacterized protein n=1 Tax=Rhizophagus irregularis TaxID=588596 RepID=A0A2I1HD33_9GLOM|nr:hypothetical protein RhiirA4_428492 [Rhizophagus irregularis]
MADARRLPVLNLIAPILAKNKPYTGQEPPDDYLDRLIHQSISFAQGHMTVIENANAGDFDDAVKCNIYKAQMGGKYLPVPAQDPYNGNANINTPDTLRVWMRSHYQRETERTFSFELQISDWNATNIPFSSFFRDVSAQLWTSVMDVLDQNFGFGLRKETVSQEMVKRKEKSSKKEERSER